MKVPINFGHIDKTLMEKYAKEVEETIQQRLQEIKDGIEDMFARNNKVAMLRAAMQKIEMPPDGFGLICLNVRDIEGYPFPSKDRAYILRSVNAMVEDDQGVVAEEPYEYILTDVDVAKALSNVEEETEELVSDQVRRLTDKFVDNAVTEIRDIVDIIRYYAHRLETAPYRKRADIRDTVIRYADRLAEWFDRR